MDILTLNTETRTEIQRTQIKAVGAYGIPGGKYTMVQGPYMVLMNPEKIQVLGPK